MPTMQGEPPPKALKDIKDRIVELRRIPAGELQANEKNWRLHPYAQRRAIVESLELIGIADVLLAYHSERNGGALTLIDGHARQEETDPSVEWPVVLLDLNDEEADMLLLTLDPMAGMAEADGKKLTELLDGAVAATPGLEDLLRNLRAAAGENIDFPTGEEEEAEETLGPKEMELQAFEHYDYVVLLFRNALDWVAAKELFGVDQQAFTMRDGHTRKIGTGRVIDGKKVLDMLQQAGVGD